MGGFGVLTEVFCIQRGSLLRGYMMFARTRIHYGLLKGLAVSMSPHVFLYRRVRQRVVQSVKFEGQDYFESLRDG